MAKTKESDFVKATKRQIRSIDKEIAKLEGSNNPLVVGLVERYQKLKQTLEKRLEIWD